MSDTGDTGDTGDTMTVPWVDRGEGGRGVGDGDGFEHGSGSGRGRGPGGASGRRHGQHESGSSGGGGDGGGTGSGGSGRHRVAEPLHGGAENRLDLRNTWQVAAGSMLIPLGVILILVSWYGSAHARVVQQQIPYLVSGSFIGLGCMLLGGLLYWAHWLYRLYDKADLHHEEHLEAMEQLIQAMYLQSSTAGGTGGGGSAVGATPASALANGAVVLDDAPRFVATLSGTVFHAVNCPVVEHHRDGLRVLGRTDVSDMEPCRLCKPVEV